MVWSRLVLWYGVQARPAGLTAPCAEPQGRTGRPEDGGAVTSHGRQHYRGDVGMDAVCCASWAGGIVLP
jgi:hypothetical protein